MRRSFAYSNNYSYYSTYGVREWPPLNSVSSCGKFWQKYPEGQVGRYSKWRSTNQWLGFRRHLMDLSLLLGKKLRNDLSYYSTLGSPLGFCWDFVRSQQTASSRFSQSRIINIEVMKILHYYNLTCITCPFVISLLQ